MKASSAPLFRVSPPTKAEMAAIQQHMCSFAAKVAADPTRAKALLRKVSVIVPRDRVNG